MIGHGFALKLDDPNYLFDPSCYYSGCRICGRLYQPELSRSVGRVPPGSPLYGMVVEDLKRWTHYHARTHPEREHIELERSGMQMTALAAYRLAAYGVLPMIDMVMREETIEALAEAPAMPTDDVEG